jgi:purine nucleosidase
MQHPAGTITLCCLGPLTNIGLALVKEPRIAARIKRIIAMGGGFFEGGNVTPTAEFNIYVDPQAARLVFESGIPITLIPLDCTHQALTTKARVQKFRDMKNNTGPATAQLLDFFERFDEQKYGTDGGPLHDPCVIAWLLHPELFTSRDVNVSVECESELTMGMTVIDWWRVTNRKANATVCRGINADGFFDLLTKRLATLA